MKAIECLRLMRKLVCGLILWNVLLTGFVYYKVSNDKQEDLNEQICNLEMIPQEDCLKFDLVEGLN